MRAATLVRLSVILPFLSVPAIQAQATPKGNCTVFDWDQQPAYFTYGTPERISGASKCAPRNNESHYCSLVADGDIQVTYRRNATSPPDACWNTGAGVSCFLHSLVLAAVNSTLAGENWRESVIGAIDQTVALEPGTSAYLNFTTLNRCFVGTLSNCTGGLEDGIVLQACAPVYHTVGANGKAIMDGEVTIVNVSASDVGNFEDPFANQVSPEEAAASMGYIVSGKLMALGVAVVFVAGLM